MIDISPSTVKKSILNAVEKIVGPERYSVKKLDRFNYSRDCNFKSTIQNRFSKVEHLPDLIVWPENVLEVQKLILLAQRFELPVVPFGAGSGVCGGTLAVFGGMIIDTKRMSRLLSVDGDRLEAVAETGILSWTLEMELQRKGYTLGHFPSSIVCAGLGGCLAARSAGQNSSRYGKMEDMVKDLEIVTGAGEIINTHEISNRRGIDLNQVFIGSEGTLGLITKTTLRVYPLPTHQAFSGFRFKDIKNGLEAIRRFMQSGLKPSVVRLYDEIDTLLLLSHGSGEKKKGSSSLSKFLKDYAQTKTVKTALLLPEAFSLLSKFLPSGCLLALVHEGNEKIVAEEKRIIASICHDLGAEDLGEGPGRYWLENRYKVSYKASKLFYEGLFTDTIEVATTWDKLLPLYNEMTRALSAHAVVMAHISHVYTEGGSIYFTFVAPLSNVKKTELLYDFIWDRAMKTCLKVGGVISHHHGIGRLKAKYMEEEWGGGAVLFQQMKKMYDPYGIMNPGKLLLLTEKKSRKEKAA